MKSISAMSRNDTHTKADNSSIFDCSKYNSCTKSINKCNKSCRGYSPCTCNGKKR